jgi:hypothetical protein
MDDTTKVPTYGLLVINHAYNEGQITFLQWLELSQAWAQKMIEQASERLAEPDLCKSPEQSPL